jgi:hypothetical protein
VITLMVRTPGTRSRPPIPDAFAASRNDFAAIEENHPGHKTMTAQPRAEQGPQG